MVTMLTTGPGTAAPIGVAFGAAKEQGRVSVVFRLILVIPQAIVLFLIGIAAFVVLVIGWFAALFTTRLPASCSDFLSGFLRWEARVDSYLFLLTDEYPPFTLEPSATYPVEVNVQTGPHNRWAVLFRYFLAIPAGIAASVLVAGLGIFSIVMWVVVLVRGALPDWMFEAAAAALRYRIRFQGYFYLLTTFQPSGVMGDGGPSSPGPPPWAPYGMESPYGAPPAAGTQLPPPPFGTPPPAAGTLLPPPPFGTPPPAAGTQLPPPPFGTPPPAAGTQLPPPPFGTPPRAAGTQLPPPPYGEASPGSGGPVSALLPTFPAVSAPVTQHGYPAPPASVPDLSSVHQGPEPPHEVAAGPSPLPTLGAPPPPGTIPPPPPPGAVPPPPPPGAVPPPPGTIPPPPPPGAVPPPPGTIPPPPPPGAVPPPPPPGAVPPPPGTIPPPPPYAHQTSPKVSAALPTFDSPPPASVPPAFASPVPSAPGLPPLPSSPQPPTSSSGYPPASSPGQPPPVASTFDAATGASVPPPATPWSSTSSPGSERSWRLILSESAKRLVVVFFVLGGLLYALWLVPTFLGVTAAANAAVAENQTASAYATLRQQAQSFDSQATTCRTFGDPTAITQCFESNDSRFASDLQAYSDTLSSIDYPRDVSTEVSALQNAVGQSSATLTRLSRVGSNLSVYVAAVGSSNVVSELNQVTATTQQLESALSTSVTT